jgi:hypothetical protein
MTGSQPRRWPKVLSWAEFWYNTNFHSSTKLALSKALYGCDPPTLLCHANIPSAAKDANQLFEERKRDQLWDELKNNLVKA